MILKVNMKASDKLINKLHTMPADLESNIQQELFFYGKLLKRTVSDSILKNARGAYGKTYRIKVHGSYRRHRSSAPNDPWRNITGRARRSIQFNVMGSRKLSLYSDVEYVKYLESGTHKMKPRPAMKLAIEKNSRNIESLMFNALDATFKK